MIERRVLWVGPWHEDSAIARFGAYVCAALAERGCHISILRSETGTWAQCPPLPAPAGGVIVSRMTEPWTAFDGIIVNIGDHFGHHGGALSVLEDVPALVILHDGYLANFAADAARAREGEPWLRQLVEELYGSSAWPLDQPYHTDLAWVAAHRPLTEWVAGLSGGVLTHSHLWEERLRAACPGPVRVRPLAYPGRRLPPKRREERLIVATLGHANPNRCLPELLQAIAAEKEAGRLWEMQVIGPIAEDMRTRLMEHARLWGVEPPVMTGWLPEEDMWRRLAAADAVACLRSPVLEAGSASLITAMRAGRPVLVCPHGPYAEVPEDLVYRCRPQALIADVRQHLADIARHPEQAAARAERAQRWAENAFSADGYAEDVLALLDAATEAWPVLAVGRRLGERLGGLRLPMRSSWVDYIAARVAAILPADGMGRRE